MIFRDELGRIIGSINNNDFFLVDDHYIDYKCENLIFPNHKENLNGEVHVWNMYTDKEKLIK